jgi:hypothetical protein
MNTKLRFVRLVIAATFGSLLWAGCASTEPSSRYETVAVNQQPVDLTKRLPGTHPEWNTGFDRMYAPVVRYDFPLENQTINEAAGAERPY